MPSPFIAPPRRTCRCAFALSAALLASFLVSVGCSTRKKAPAPVTRYQALPPKEVPAFLRGTIFERSDLVDLDPLVISGFGLVVNLEGTGDNTQVPTPVRTYMVREMVKRGFGSKLLPGFERTSPEDVLRDPRTAIVRADAIIPPGARRGEFIDVRVTTLPGSNTSSLSHGILYRTELKIGGANPMAPGETINVIALAQGPVLVNPAYALSTRHEDPAARRSLRTGWVLDGGQLQEPRPLTLRLRQPDRRIARLTEGRIDNRFSIYKDDLRDRTAAAQDEAIVRVSIPPRFRGDWNHFSGLMLHLYYDSSPQFVAQKAQELAQEAVLPNAPLLNISYCWEGLGAKALPFITPLMTHEKPEVAFAAARAAAFLGDASAPLALAAMARSDQHPFQLNAVQALGALDPSPAISGMLRQLLESNQNTVRIEAYRVLAAQRDSAVISQVVDERFVLDIVPSGGEPLVYATRSGIPRIALIGPRPTLAQPFVYTTMDDRLTLTSNRDGQAITLFFRPGRGETPARVLSRADLAEVIARLGGDQRAGSAALKFTYGDIVAILQELCDQKHVVASTASRSQSTPARFVLQQPPAVAEAILEAPVIPEQSRPAGTGAATQPTALDLSTIAAPSPEPAGGAEAGRPN